MNAVAHQGRRVIGGAVDLFVTLLPFFIIAAVLAVGSWQVAEAFGRWERGIYAGFHYVDAKKVAINALVVQYGRDNASRLRLADPPVVNTHSRSLLVDGQIRVFHLIGPRGTRYCVSVWNPRYNWSAANKTGINIGGDVKIEKGCTF